MRVLKLLALCLVVSAACAQAGEPTARETSFSAHISPLNVAPENLAGISATGRVTLIYALRFDTARQTPGLPDQFGGLSSLWVRAIEGDTIVFDALTDQGHLARFTAPNPLTYGQAAPPSGSQIALTPLTDPAGKPLHGANQVDSEGLAITDTGFLISFERDHRLIELVQTEAGYKSQQGPHLTGFDGLEPNGGIEALTRLPDGRYLAAAEYGPDRGNDPAAKLKAPFWIFDVGGTAITAPQGHFDNQGRFGITDIRVLDQELWVLKRSYDPQTKINLSRLETCGLSSVLAGKPSCSLKLALAPPFPMDNYEGLAVMKDPQSGETIILILSDDNFSSDQSTNLLSFRLNPSTPPDALSPGVKP